MHWLHSLPQQIAVECSSLAANSSWISWSLEHSIRWKLSRAKASGMLMRVQCAVLLIFCWRKRGQCWWWVWSRWTVGRRSRIILLCCRGTCLSTILKGSKKVYCCTVKSLGRKAHSPLYICEKMIWIQIQTFYSSSSDESLVSNPVNSNSFSKAKSIPYFSLKSSVWRFTVQVNCTSPHKFWRKY